MSAHDKADMQQAAAWRAANRASSPPVPQQLAKLKSALYDISSGDFDATDDEVRALMCVIQELHLAVPQQEVEAVAATLTVDDFVRIAGECRGAEASQSGGFILPVTYGQAVEAEVLRRVALAFPQPQPVPQQGAEALAACLKDVLDRFAIAFPDAEEYAPIKRARTVLASHAETVPRVPAGRELEDRLRMAFAKLGLIRRRYGEVGSRDVDVTANNEAVNLARKAIFDVLASMQAEAPQATKDAEVWKKLYRDMRNVAAGYSNFCEENGSTRKLEKEFSNIEDAARKSQGEAP